MMNNSFPSAQSEQESPFSPLGKMSEIDRTFLQRDIYLNPSIGKAIELCLMYKLNNDVIKLSRRQRTQQKLIESEGAGTYWTYHKLLISQTTHLTDRYLYLDQSIPVLTEKLHAYRANEIQKQAFQKLERPKGNRKTPSSSHSTSSSPPNF